MIFDLLKIFKSAACVSGWRVRSQHSSSGFTLIEVMVVVVIIGMLAAIVVPRVMVQQEKAAITKAKSDISQLSTALKLYKLDNFKYPTTSEGLETLASEGKRRSYIETLPNDPWGNPYQYLYPGEHLNFDIWSLGANGQIGGEGENSDIGNWNLHEIK